MNLVDHIYFLFRTRFPLENLEIHDTVGKAPPKLTTSSTNPQILRFAKLFRYLEAIHRKHLWSMIDTLGSAPLEIRSFRKKILGRWLIQSPPPKFQHEHEIIRSQSPHLLFMAIPHQSHISWSTKIIPPSFHFKTSLS